MLSVQRVERIGESVILYDASLVNHMHEAWFEPAHWAGALHATGASSGRGTTLFIRCEGQDAVLRHYYRGGLVARLVRDRFLWLGERRTRSFAEWRLLAHLQAAGLPAPRPLAARYCKSGPFYSADLITVRLPGVVPLATRMARGQVGEMLWRQVGACIGRFHAAGVFHADLNAHNVQVSGGDEVFLLDFDRGCLMHGPGGWQTRNLQRLQRSLHKVSAARGQSFATGDWEALLAGYRQRQPRL